MPALTPRERSCLDLIANCGAIAPSLGDLATVCGGHRTAADRVVRALIRKGVLHRGERGIQIVRQHQSAR